MPGLDRRGRWEPRLPQVEDVVIIWLFDKSGFTSVVGFKPSKDLLKTKHREVAEASDNPDGWLLVRARVKDDLEAVEKVLGKDIYILKDAGADYAYRALVTREDWKTYLMLQVDAIDYDSHFKEVVRDNAPAHPKRYSVMMQVWTALASMQDTPPYGYHRTGSHWGSSSAYGSYYGGSAGKGKGKVATYDPKLVDKELDAEGDWGSVGIEEMRTALHDVGNDPNSIDQKLVENADDEAWELWCQTFDLTRDAQGDLLTDEAVDELALDIAADESVTAGAVGNWVPHSSDDTEAGVLVDELAEAITADGVVEISGGAWVETNSGTWVPAIQDTDGTWIPDLSKSTPEFLEPKTAEKVE